MSNNHANHGGAILAVESTITVYGETTIANNQATRGSGGGIELSQSSIKIQGICIVSQNYAMEGGGIYATSSTITVHQPGALQFINNSADIGGGMYLGVNPRLNLLISMADKNTGKLIKFSGNHAIYGGAVYVADDTSSAACLTAAECFIQSLALYQFVPQDSRTINIFFSENIATKEGSNLFGGLLDRCLPSPFAEVHIKHETQYSGITYIGNISNITLDSIASLPIKVCFCNSEYQPDCSYQLPPMKVKKGETFSVSIVAVDQVDHLVDATINSSLTFPGGGFGEGQQMQEVNKSCTELIFNVFSPEDTERIMLFANGPCGSSAPSIRHVGIQFLNCTCSVGFEASDRMSSRCECNCHSALSPYITKCNYKTKSLLRDTNSWITYISDTDPPGYVVHPNCPFDYCHPPTKKINLL